MFCPKCGTEIIEGLFCPKCGTKLENDTVSSEMPEEKADNNLMASAEPMPDSDDNLHQTSPAGQTDHEGVRSSKSKYNYTLIGGMAIAVLALLVVFIVIASNHKIDVNLDKYVSVDFSGYDTLGRADVSIDWNTFERDYAGKIKINKSALKKQLKKELPEEYGEMAVNDEFVNDYLNDYLKKGAVTLIRYKIGSNGKLDRSSGLSNGDEVVFAWDLNKDELGAMERYLKCRFRHSEKLTFTVKDLEIVGTFDPFTGLEVKFEGIAPEGKASISQKSDTYRYDLSYDIDREKGLSNGDTVTVSVGIVGADESFISKYGKLPSPREKTYTVSGLMSYISTSKDIPDELMLAMQSQAEDIIRAVSAQDWSDEASIKSLTYLGNYFLTKKGDSRADENRCVLVYKITTALNMHDAKNKKDVVQDQSFYYYVSFKDLMTEENGKGAVDISAYDKTYNQFKVETDVVKSDGWWESNYSFYFYGFEDLDKLYNEVVTKNLEKYYHEDNVEE